jgi:TatD DNase family protein
VKWNRGVIHGYSYSKSELDFFLDLGWYISFSGEITHVGKKGSQDMAEIIEYVPKDRILVESDSPYYAPVPLKNTANTPNNIIYIYDYIASKRHVPVTKFCSTVDENFKKAFL